MQLIHQVGRSKVNAAIMGIGTWGYGCRIGGPHAGGAATGSENCRCLLGRLLQHFFICATEAYSAQCMQIGAFLRRQHALDHPHIGQRLGFLQALLGRSLGVGGLGGIT